jgi:hypothetical protein
MKAKLILNEIKQNKEGTGLGAIGVGKAHIRSTYNSIKKNWPELLNKTVKEKFENFAGQVYANNIKPYIEELSDVLGAKLDEMYWVKSDYANHGKSNVEFLDFMAEEYGIDGIPGFVQNEKFPHYDTYDEAHIRIDTNYKKSFGSISYSETCGEGFKQYEQNEINGFFIPFN